MDNELANVPILFIDMKNMQSHTGILHRIFYPLVMQTGVRSRIPAFVVISCLGGGIDRDALGGWQSRQWFAYFKFCLNSCTSTTSDCLTIASVVSFACWKVMGQ